MNYTIQEGATHTCWETDEWDGCMRDDGGCAGCVEALDNPCRFCGYGHAFPTHSDEAHTENGDPDVPNSPTDAWYNSPHVYESS